MEKILILLAISVSLFLNLATYAPPVSFFLDIATNLQGYLLSFQLILTAFLFYKLLKFRKASLLISLTLMLVLDYRIFADIKNFYFYPENPPFSSGVEEPKVNIYFAKLGSLDSLEELKKQIKNSQANLILLKNYNPTISLALIQTLKTTEQINVLHYKKHDFDLLIFSQLDLEDIQQNFDQEQELPNYLIAKIRLNQTITTNFIFFNALSPLIESNFHNNKAYCRRLATVVKNSQEPQIVVGSFLATPHSLCYNWFTAKERTKDVLWGKGFVKTWKVNNPLLNLKLDHIFYNSFWRLTNSASLPSLDQVHFPQSASFTFDQSFSNSALGNSDKS